MDENDKEDRPIPKAVEHGRGGGIAGLFVPIEKNHDSVVEGVKNSELSPNYGMIKSGIIISIISLLCFVVFNIYISIIMMVLSLLIASIASN